MYVYNISTSRAFVRSAHVHDPILFTCRNSRGIQPSANMKCSACALDFTDGVHCASCGSDYDFACANLTEIGYRKLGADRRASWKCPHRCRASLNSPAPPQNKSPAPAHKIASAGPVTLEAIMAKLTNMETKLAAIPQIQTDLRDVKETCEFYGAKIDSLTNNMSMMEKRINNLEPMKEDLATTKDNLEREMTQSRYNNVEIKGVPIVKSENLFEIVEKIENFVGYNFPRSNINYISRVPVHGSNEKNIIVSFVNRYIKEEFLATARAKKTILTTDIGYHGESNRIFLNDHLTPKLKMLLTKTKKLAKDKNYLYVWVKFSKIHVRKSDTSRPQVINSINDLNKLT